MQLLKKNFKKKGFRYPFNTKRLGITSPSAARDTPKRDGYFYLRSTLSMRKSYFGRQLKRDTNERKALFKNLIRSLVIHERIETTTAKAKAIRSQTEKLVTKAKRNSDNATYFLQPYLSGVALDKMVTDIAPRFVDRQGGYVRIIKTGNRLKDNAEMSIIEWVDGSKITANLSTSATQKSKDKKKDIKKKQKKEATGSKVTSIAREMPTKTATTRVTKSRRRTPNAK